MRFFNPRVDQWTKHFELSENGQISPLTDIGKVTSTIFQFNAIERVEERAALIALGRFIF